MEMARAARIAAIGVAWGYHPPQSLADAGAFRIIAHFGELPEALAALWAVDESSAAASAIPALPLKDSCA
jgi:phosphoglycolate phosphatase